MKCDKCGSHRVLSVTGKVSDACYISGALQENDGYVPSDLGIGSDDYLRFSYCLECGKMQGTFPIVSDTMPYFKISEVYPDGLCPDCNTPISDDALPEEACENCGHVFVVE